MTPRGVVVARRGAPSSRLTTRSPAAYAEESRSARTRERYRSVWRTWTRWARAHNLPPLPASPADLCAWITEEAARGIRPSTLAAHLSAIGYAHRVSGHPSPCTSPELRAVLGGIRRVHGTAIRRKSPLLLDQLVAAVEGCGDDLAGRRDAAMVCVGWAAALRRSELAALRVDDLEHTEEGITITLRRSKTDQEGAGRRIGVPHAQQLEAVCPPCRLEEWLSAAGISAGPLFRRITAGGQVGAHPIHGGSIARVIKARLGAVGLAGDWAGHSLRSGLVTQSARAGVDIFTIMATTGHRKVDTVADYVREAELFRKNAATLAGL